MLILKMPSVFFPSLTFAFFISIFCFGQSDTIKAQADSLALVQDSSKIYTDLADALQNKIQVKKLKLRRQKYTQIPAEIFTEFPNLEYLDLAKNKIEIVPAEVKNLKKLKFLNLDKNKLETLPKEIGDLSELRTLIVSQNVLVYLPSSIADLQKLEKLDLWNNDLNGLPEEMSEMESLKEVDLRVILFNNDQQKRIKEMLPAATVVHFSPGCNCGK